MKKPITNLLITGITTCKQMKKLKKENKRLKKSQKKPWTTDQLTDKDLVWCWDNSDTHRKALVFYDAVNKLPFSFNGAREGCSWANYAPFKGKEPKWAKEARKSLALSQK